MAKRGLASQSAAHPDLDQIAVGQRLRREREERKVSLRALARRLDISASALSQIETGKSRPSVKTLYAIVSELGLSIDELFADAAKGRAGAAGPSTAEQAAAARPNGDRGAEAPPVVQRAGARPSVELDHGVTWARLTSAHDPDVDFLYTTYRPDSSSGGSDRLVRHNGREYGVLLSGQLELTVGFETFLLGPGDSCSFDSSEPHRLANPGTEPARAIWFVIGRRSSDARSPDFDAS